MHGFVFIFAGTLWKNSGKKNTMAGKTFLIQFLFIVGMHQFICAQPGYEISVTIKNMKDDVLVSGLSLRR